MYTASATWQKGKIATLLPGIWSMAKKFFVPRANIVKGERWLIDYLVIDPETGKQSRHRNEFGLNDVPLPIREEVANCLIKCVEKVLRGVARIPIGAPPVQAEPAMTLHDAVEFSLKLKMSGPRENTHKNYKSIGRYLVEWMTTRSYTRMLVTEFGKRHARAFMDWYITRKPLRGVTINNRVTHLRALWYELINREICPENPWTSIKPVREEEKKRRPFNPEERRVVAAEVERRDYWLFRGLLLQYYCYIRPEELRRLKFRAFDLGRGVVKVESFEAKKWKARWATIPRSVLHYFVDGRFDRVPANYFVFGMTGTRGLYRLGPASKAASKSVAYRRHQKILKELKAAGRLSNIDGLTWYSWKDTGITEHARKTSPLATRDQAGHEDFDMTLTYYHQEQVNAEYQKLGNDLFL